MVHCKVVHEVSALTRGIASDLNTRFEAIQRYLKYDDADFLPADLRGLKRFDLEDEVKILKKKYDTAWDLVLFIDEYAHKKNCW